MASRTALFIVGAKRTPFGVFGGKLKGHSATDLAEIASRAALQAASVSPEKVDHIIIGNVMQSSADSIYLSRHTGLRIGLPESIPAVTTNRLCGSGFQAIVDACHQILAGDSGVVIAGGSESMSQAPFVVRNVRFGTVLGTKYELEDTLWEGLTDAHVKMPMGMTAEKLGNIYKITREEADEFAHNSQTRWRLANNGGYFKAEITPTTIKTRKDEVQFDIDEHPRETTYEALAKLPSVFTKNGLVTAGNASGVCDGAASVVVAGEKSVTELHLQPLARIVDWKVVGCDPSIMGIGPVPAIRALLDRNKLTLDQIDLIEVNEAFASQTLSVQRELDIDPDKLNVNGGAIALGHPLAASGARITAHLTHEFRRRGISCKYAIGSACIGGGQGIALLLQSV